MCHPSLKIRNICATLLTINHWQEHFDTTNLNLLIVRHFYPDIAQRKGITTLRIYQNGIFHHTVIETCFEMLNPSEHQKLLLYSNYKFPIFKFFLKLDQLIPQFYFTINFLRTGSPGYSKSLGSCRSLG